MLNSMEISRWKFEQELDALLEAAKSARSKRTAEGFLKEAWSKTDAYYNIPDDLVKSYKRKVEDLADELGIEL